ncbi:MAG TPA: Ig-like domain-containing protein [Longimicrobiaceae bacterium]|nr:Ig-like domain-containing protein [Longimicrobiaceae bacterium]
MRIALSLLALAIFGFSACAKDGTSPDPMPRGVALTIQVDIAGTSVTAMSVEVTGPGISTPIRKDLTISGGVASGTVTVPAGSERTFTVHALDSHGVETNRGSTTVTVTENDNAAISITLYPLTGDVPISATIGTYTVVVSPAADTVQVGDTLQFSATVTDVTGDTVRSPALVWASENPAVAAIDSTGLAVAENTGSVGIAVSYSGFAARANLTIR